MEKQNLVPRIFLAIHNFTAVQMRLFVDITETLAVMTKLHKMIVRNEVGNSIVNMYDKGEYFVLPINLKNYCKPSQYSYYRKAFQNFENKMIRIPSNNTLIDVEYKSYPCLFRVLPFEKYSTWGQIVIDKEILNIWMEDI